MHRPFYITSKNFLTPEQCRALIDDSKSHAEAMEGGVYGEPDDKGDLGNADTMTVDKETRNCKVYTMDWFVHSTVYDYIWRHILLINRVWNFDLSHFSDGQVIEYNKGDFFKPHVDQGFMMNTFVLERKLSITIQLNSREEFEGGRLTINGESADMDMGDLIVFPSILVHEVEEVTGGTRYAFVGWVDGAPWR